MLTRTTKARSEQGAIVLHVALALLALLAFGAFVVDYGVLWVSRGQAQNAADAAAFAAATALSLDTPPVGGTSGPAKAAATAFAAKNAIWGTYPSAGDIDVVTSYDGFNCPSNLPTATLGNNCVRVDVFRGTPDRSGAGTRGPALPVFFARLVGLNQQGIRATSMGQSAPGDLPNDARPWAILDKFTDSNGNGKYDVDEPYTPPSQPGTTGYTTADFGTQINLDGDETSYTNEWRGEVCLEGNCSSYDSYEEFITDGYDGKVPIASASTTCGSSANLSSGCVEIIDINTSAGSGHSCHNTSRTQNGVQDLIAKDSGASWDTSKKCVVNSNKSFSPRIVPILILDTKAYKDAAASCGSKNPVGKVVNIAGLFVEGIKTGDAGKVEQVYGRLCNYPTSKLANTSSGTKVQPSSSFLKCTRLAR